MCRTTIDGIPATAYHKGVSGYRSVPLPAPNGWHVS
jgi:hypothetical protein